MVKNQTNLQGTPRIGVFVLETLTTGMYTQPLDTIREYVQNAFDSIRAAEESKTLSGRGRIVIELDKEKRRLSVTDDGVGVPTAEFLDRLLTIGSSEKSITRDAGFRGIGRLAGIAYCERLVFETSAAGEAEGSALEIDCNFIRKGLDPRNRTTQELTDLLAKYSARHSASNKKQEHYFRVTLDGILPEHDVFLNWAQIEEYLAQVAPVDFDPQEFPFASKIAKWAQKNGVQIPTVKVLLRDRCQGITREITKPYTRQYATSHQRGGVQKPVEVKDISFFPDRVTNGVRCWAWFAETDLPGTIGDPRCVGFRLRKNNIALGGPENGVALFEEHKQQGRFSKWYIGEIHVTSENAFPNARRDGFESNQEWLLIKEQLRPFIAERAREPNVASRERNAPEVKLKKATENTVSKVRASLKAGVVPEKEKKQLLKTVREQQAKVDDVLRKSRKTQDKGIVALASKLDNLEQELDTDSDPLDDIALRPGEKQLVESLLSTAFDVLGRTGCEASSECYQKVKTRFLRSLKASRGTR